MAQPERRHADAARPAARHRALPGADRGDRRRDPPVAGTGRAEPRSVQPAGVATRPRVRPRVPRAPRGGAVAGRRAPAARLRRHAVPGPLRPHSPAVGLLCDRGSRVRPRGAGVEDPPLRRRRHRCRTDRRGVPPAGEEGAESAERRPRGSGRRRRGGGPCRARRRLGHRLGARHGDAHDASAGRDRAACARRGGDARR